MWTSFCCDTFVTYWVTALFIFECIYYCPIYKSIQGKGVLEKRLNVWVTLYWLALESQLCQFITVRPHILYSRRQRSPVSRAWGFESAQQTAEQQTFCTTAVEAAHQKQLITIAAGIVSLWKHVSIFSLSWLLLCQETKQSCCPCAPDVRDR